MPKCDDIFICKWYRLFKRSYRCGEVLNPEEDLFCNDFKKRKDIEVLQNNLKQLEAKKVKKGKRKK